MPSNDWVRYAAMGIDKGLDAYDSGVRLKLAQQQADQENAMKQAQLQQQGFIKNPDYKPANQGFLGIGSSPEQGSPYIENEEHKQAGEYQKSLVQRNMRGLDPSSPESKSAQGVATEALRQYPQYKGLLAQIPTMSEADLKDQNGLIGKIVSGELAAKGQQARASGYQGMNDIRQGNLVISANKEYEKNMNPAESQIASADKVNSLMQGISNKELKATPQLATELSSAIAGMIAAKPATVYGMQHQELDSAYARAQKLQGLITGGAVNTITDAQLNQLKKDVSALRKEYVIQHEKKFNSFIKGMPESVKEPLSNRYGEFRNQFQADQPLNQGLLPQGAAPSPAPTPGAVDNGYRFNGGDPADQKNWTKVQ